jgi:pimeloyl-ACP methyl ester carboxylesterase
LLPEVAQRYARGDDNARAAARLWLHPQHGSRRRPVVVLVHGYLAGRHSMEEGVWPSSWLYGELGLDLAFFVLPYHGVRKRRAALAAPAFPSSDPRVTNEGFRQAMGDLGDLVSWLQSQGHPEVGVMGMSLGGYTTALAATVHPRLSFAVPVIPLTSLADFARDQGRLGEDDAQAELEHAALDAVHAWVSPLHRAPKLAPDRMMILAAEADRITPIRHAERLAEHFGAPLHRWHGGHLLQLGRSEGFREVGRFLNRIGVVADRRRRR